MATKFLPALRGRSAAPARGGESKQLGFSDYYAGLLVAGVNIDAAAARKRWTMERAVVEGYERAIWCYKPVDAIAREHLRTPLVMTTKSGDEIKDHPYYRLLNTGLANPMEPAHVFRKRLVMQLMLSPRGVFVEETLSNAGTPARLDLLPPGRTRIIPGMGSDLIAYYECTMVNGTRRFIDPEKVRWIRDPHPTDPFGAMTPLEAAGLSIELDYFARLYNVSFLRNDGRPGGVLGVDGDMDEEDMDRLESKFGKGPVEAGRLSVITGDIKYVDTGAKPRDMQYGVLSKTAKEEILSAFGTPSTIFGSAEGKTFANADAEREVFWQHTMVPANAIVATGFSNDDDIVVAFDHSGIEAMQRAAMEARSEERDEVAAGVRSLDEYRGNRDDLKPLDNAYSRALWMVSGKTPIPAKPEDAAELGLGAPAPAPGAGPTDPNAPVTTESTHPGDATAAAPTPPAPTPADGTQAGPIPGTSNPTDASGDAVIPGIPAFTVSGTP